MIKKFQFFVSYRDYLSGLAIIFASLWVGKQISHLLGDLVPGSIVGMLLLAALLQLRLIPLSWVERTAAQFVRWMSLLFVPIGVGLVDHLDSLMGAMPAMLLTCVLGTLLLLWLVGFGYQLWEKRQ